MKHKKWILGIILLLICILFAYTTYTTWLTYEGFSGCPTGTKNVGGYCVCSSPDQKQDPKSGNCVCSNAHYVVSNMSNSETYNTPICIPNVITANAPVRNDNTCSDGRQTYTFDRFARAVYADMSKPVNIKYGACTYESSNNNVKYNLLSNYFDTTNLCLEACPSNFSLSPTDNTLCIANSCLNTTDLSYNIIDSWRQVCGPLYKTQLQFTSTLNSVSSVTGSLNIQYQTASNDVGLLSNGMYVSGAPNASIRDLRFPAIQSNYMNMANIISDTNKNYKSLNATKSNFDSYYYSFLCDRYY